MKRMFRVALSYTVAVEANSDAQAFVAAQYASPLDPTVRKLSATVLASWLDKPKEVDLPQAVPAAERPGKPEDDIPF